jgi:hypothetical protein
MWLTRSLSVGREELRDFGLHNDVRQGLFADCSTQYPKVHSIEAPMVWVRTNASNNYPSIAVIPRSPEAPRGTSGQAQIASPLRVRHYARSRWYWQCRSFPGIRLLDVNVIASDMPPLKANNFAWPHSGEAGKHGNRVFPKPKVENREEQPYFRKVMTRLAALSADRPLTEIGTLREVKRTWAQKFVRDDELRAERERVACTRMAET